MAGLLAARVLTDHFDRVTVIERDRFAEAPSPRRGVPQARHVHILLARGRLILEQLFPGIEAELIAQGAVKIDVTADLLFLGVAGWLPRFPSSLWSISCSRDLLEWNVRRRLAALPQARFVQEHDAVDVLASADRTAVLGVRAPSRGQLGDAEEMQAGLVVDASGRSSRAPKWLETMGYPAPRETIVNSFLGYASRVYARPASFPGDWQGVITQSKPPETARGGGIMPIEGERWLVTLAGAARDYPPTGEAGFLDFARSLRSPIVYDAITDAEPLSPIYGYQRTENRLLHYEAMPRWPDRFVVIGDAVCAFNPVYGQGMTTAGLGALTLDRCLRTLNGRGLDGFAAQFQKQLAKTNADPWLMATGEDFRYPTTEGGNRTWLVRFMHRYMDEVMLLCAERADVYETFGNVLHLMKPPRALFRPGIVRHAIPHMVIQRPANGNANRE